ncbi:MAG: isochorismatase family protein [Chloroflexota bacterium]
MDRAALVIVDMQNDFLPGGSLPVPGGDKVVATLNRYIELFDSEGRPIIATRDWHPAETTHFQSSGGTWPVHCVQGTSGAEFHGDLNLPDSTVVISKGMGAREDAYSGFQGSDAQGRSLAEVLRSLDVEHLYVGGVATDYCTVATALAALAEGFKVTVLLDTVRGINLKPGDIENALADMARNGANFTTIEGIQQVIGTSA